MDQGGIVGLTSTSKMKKYQYTELRELKKQYEYYFSQKELYSDRFQVHNRLLLKGNLFIYSCIENGAIKFKIAEYSEQEEYIFDLAVEFTSLELAKEAAKNIGKKLISIPREK